MKLLSSVMRIGAIGVVAFAGAFGSGAQVSAQSATSSAEPSCSSSFDPYAVPVSVLQRCGLKTFPRASATRRPDGGMQYVYFRRRNEGCLQPCHRLA